jgi:LacI family transcriptional regulator
MAMAAFKRRHASFTERAAATGAVVQSVDLSPTPPDTFDPVWERRRIAKSLRPLPAPIGIMCPDAGIAYRVFGALHSIGCRVPDDAMVVACEDDEVAALACRPQLSAIDCRGRAVGYEAAALLHRLLDGDASVAGEYRQWVAPGPLVRRASTQPTRTRDTAIRAALEFMREQLAKPISVDDIATHVNLSRRTLERLFRRETGRSPASDLLAMRLELAAQLLAESPRRVAEVSARCGFRSVTHFNSQFRKRYHCTPTEYRLRQIAGPPDRD